MWVILRSEAESSLSVSSFGAVSQQTTATSGGLSVKEQLVTGIFGNNFNFDFGELGNSDLYLDGSHSKSGFEYQQETQLAPITDSTYDVLLFLSSKVDEK